MLASYNRGKLLLCKNKMITKLGTGNKVKVNLSFSMPGGETQGNSEPRHQMHNSGQFHALLLLAPYPLNRLSGSHRQSGHFGTKIQFLVPAGN